MKCVIAFKFFCSFEHLDFRSELLVNISFVSLGIPLLCTDLVSCLESLTGGVKVVCGKLGKERKSNISNLSVSGWKIHDL